MRVLALITASVVALAFALLVVRREQVRRARLDRHGLDDLRRIYRRDNPRGPGLEPLTRDQQAKIRPKGRWEP